MIITASQANKFSTGLKNKKAEAEHKIKMCKKDLDMVHVPQVSSHVPTNYWVLQRSFKLTAKYTYNTHINVLECTVRYIDRQK